jgi:hypothetical protein
MESNFDIFNLSLDNFKTEEKKQEVSNIYKTDPKLSKDSVYRSIVRFIPNLNNPKKSIIRKFSYWLEDATGAGFYADCPSSTPGEKSIIQDTFWKLYKSESAFEKKQAERMKRKEYYYSYVYIVKDPQRPELENTVQILRFPKAVKKMIDAQIQPSAEDIEMGVEPTNIFDFFGGKDFSLKVTLKGGYWNYDECKFGSSATAIQLNGAKMDNNEEGRKMIMSIYEGVNALEDNEFKPWSEDLQNKVYAYLQELTGNPGTAYANVTTPKADKPISSSIPPVAGTTVNNISKEIPSIDEAASGAAKSSDGDIEDWLKEFDIK